MNGVQTQYFLGIYFLVISLTYSNGRFSADAVKLIAGLILFLTAIFGLTFLRF